MRFAVHSHDAPAEEAATPACLCVSRAAHIAGGARKRCPPLPFLPHRQSTQRLRGIRGWAGRSALRGAAPESSPANSTPVGPPPTTTTCSRRSRSSGLRPAGGHGAASEDAPASLDGGAAGAHERSQGGGRAQLGRPRPVECTSWPPGLLRTRSAAAGWAPQQLPTRDVGLVPVGHQLAADAGGVGGVPARGVGGGTEGAGGRRTQGRPSWGGL